MSDWNSEKSQAAALADQLRRLADAAGVEITDSLTPAELLAKLCDVGLSDEQEDLLAELGERVMEVEKRV